MKHLYFVRHAGPVHDWDEDRMRPLSDEGVSDCALVTEAFRNIKVDRFISSPFRRSFDTILGSAIDHHKEIMMDERLRERDRGNLPNSWEIIKKRWTDFSYHEERGESLGMVQRRNIEAILELLNDGSPTETLVIGTHGTAMSTILNYFDPAFGFEDFKHIIDYMPYIIRLDFDGLKCIGKEEILIVEKPFIDRYKNTIVTRPLNPAEIQEALRLVWDTFLEFEASDYVPEGIDTFKACIDDQNFVGKLTFYGAFLHGHLAGVLATRNNGSHVALFFVRKEYQRRGIGKKLFECVKSNCTTGRITVNSSPYAVWIYERLGFVSTDSELTKDGIRYTPMEYLVNAT